MNTRRVWKGTFAAVLMAWQSAAGTGHGIPSSGRPMYFGYYHADGRWGDFTDTVWSYTNLYVANAGGYDTAVDWRPLFQRSMQRAADHGKSVLLLLGGDDDPSVPGHMDDVLQIAKPFWKSVVLIEVAHEKDLTPQSAERRIDAVRRALDERGLAHKPFGVTYTRAQSLNDEGMRAPGVGWVAVEAYVDPPTVKDSSACSERPPSPSPGPSFVPSADCSGWVPVDHPLARLPGSVTDLNHFLEQVKRRIPSDKQIVLIMMAYDRNGHWKNQETLAALQLPVYLHAYSDPRVSAILMFGYGQPGGTRFYPQLQAIHRQIGEQILSASR